MGARNRVGKGLLYRPARLHRLAESIHWLHKRLKLRNWVGIWLSHRPARLHRLTEFILWNRFLGSINVWKYGLSIPDSMLCWNFRTIYGARRKLVGISLLYWPARLHIGLRNRFLGIAFTGLLNRAGIFKQSMGTRNREGKRLLYRPARLHRLAESIPCNRFLGSSLKIPSLKWVPYQQHGGGGGRKTNL